MSLTESELNEELAAVLRHHSAWLDREAKRADMRGGAHGQLVGCEPGAGHRKVAWAIDTLLATIARLEAANAELIAIAARFTEERLTLSAENAALRVDGERLRKGLLAVENLINESYGVDGLHLNGDMAPWDELLTGGNFESWLMDFDTARHTEEG